MKAIILFALTFFALSVQAQWTTNGTRIYNSNTGGVGIGISTPDGFQVNRSLTSESSQGTSNIRMGIMGGAPRLIFDMAGSSPFQIDNSGGQLRIFNPGVVRMVINPDGNVGIGTTAPGSFKLAVEGKIGAREINVTTTTPWPDYVFDSNYKLSSLEEIKAYIKENKHLPEVPSAEEMEASGINLGEMNQLLLKKIEELTLYLIQDRELIDQLIKENQARKEELNKLKTTTK